MYQFMNKSETLCWPVILGVYPNNWKKIKVEGHASQLFNFNIIKLSNKYAALLKSSSQI